MSTNTDIKRQFAKAQAVYDYLAGYPNVWVSVMDIIAATRALSVSTKISQAREMAAMDGLEIVWNRNVRNSCYMLRPKALGRDAVEQVPSTWNQDRPFGETPFTLKP